MRGEPGLATWPSVDAAWVERIEPAGDGCWRWLGTLSSGRPVRGHRQARRVVWEALRSPIPPGMRVRVTCARLDCVNPDHVRLVELGAHGRGRYRRGCRCPVCRRAEYAGRRRYRLAVALDGGHVPGRWAKPGPVRTHVLELRAAGLTLTAIAATAGLEVTSLYPLVRGDRRQVTRSTEARLLAVAPTPGVPLEPVAAPNRRDYRDPAPIRARLDELHAAGLPWVEIQRRSGLSEHVIRQLRRRRTRRVTGQVADRITAIPIPRPPR
jgi:hypothetical protein